MSEGELEDSESFEPHQRRESSNAPKGKGPREEVVRAIERLIDPTLALEHACVDRFEQHKENLSKIELDEGQKEQLWNFVIDHPDETQQPYRGFISRSTPNDKDEDVSRNLVIGFRIFLNPSIEVQIEYRLEEIVGGREEGQKKWLCYAFINDETSNGRSVSDEQLQVILQCMDDARPDEAPDTLDS